MIEFNEKPFFTFYNGVTVELSPIAPILINMVNNSVKDKPKPPKIEVTYGNNKTVFEPNLNDVNYLSELQDWESQKQLRLLKLIYTRGVKGSYYELIGVDEMDSIDGLAEEIFELPTEDDRKYIYIASLLITPEEIERFQNAVLQLTVPTQDAIQDSFREV